MWQCGGGGPEKVDDLYAYESVRTYEWPLIAVYFYQFMITVLLFYISDPLKELVNLQKLNASGNLIGSVDSLQSLSSLDSFTNLILHDSVTDLNNPVCLNASYKSNVAAILPRLAILDGERLTGKGSELYQLCQKLDAMLEGSCVVIISFLSHQNWWYVLLLWFLTQCFFTLFYYKYHSLYFDFYSCEVKAFSS